MPANRSRSPRRHGGRRPANRERIPIELRFRVANAIDPAEAAYQANMEALKDVASYVRRVAINNARKSDKSAPPGKPWRSHVGFLRKAIAWELDQNRQLARVGPQIPFGAGTAPHALEYGGKNVITVNVSNDGEPYFQRQQRRRESRRRRAAKRRAGKRTYSRVERERIAAYYGLSADRKKLRHNTTKRKISVHIAARPAMHIALHQAYNAGKIDQAFRYLYWQEYRNARKHFRSGASLQRWVNMVKATAAKRRQRRT